MKDKYSVREILCIVMSFVSMIGFMYNYSIKDTHSMIMWATWFIIYELADKSKKK